jgi:hypothetical protein
LHSICAVSSWYRPGDKQRTIAFIPAGGQEKPAGHGDVHDVDPLCAPNPLLSLLLASDDAGSYDTTLERRHGQSLRNASVSSTPPQEARRELVGLFVKQMPVATFTLGCFPLFPVPMCLPLPLSLNIFFAH